MERKELKQNDSIFLNNIAFKAEITSSEFTIVKNWLADQLISQQFAKLGQGGHTNSQVPLSHVFIDLPIKTHDHDLDDRVLFLENFFKSQPINIRQALKSNSDLHSIELIGTEEINEIIVNNRSIHNNLKWSATLLIGGPGQGKSTLTQLACQFHRAALIRPYMHELTTVQKETVESFFPNENSINSLEPPQSLLLPIQITLPDFAEWVALIDEQNITSNIPLFLQFIEDLPSSKNIKLKASTIFKLICVTPSLIILDGFDEVGSLQDRERIVKAVREIINALADHSASAQILATTRPQGYADEFSQIGLKLHKMILAPLQKQEALTYANKLIQTKIIGADLQAKAYRQITEAATEPSTERLLSTPLQVTILTALIQQLGRAPKERWNLFSKYFTYTFDREIERETYASSLLAEHRAHIEKIHARVGLLLQVEAERHGRASARMSKARLEEVIAAVLTEDEIAVDQQKELISNIANAAENRLVFLVEPEPGKFGFEIRSLQEFMAAWALSSGRDSEIEARLIQISKSPMFRNVLLFMSSKLFSESSPLRDILADHICKYLDEETVDELSKLSRSGSRLALEILEEGSALTQPKRARALMLRAVRLLDIPASYEHNRLLKIANDETRPILIDAIEKCLINSVGKKSIENSAAWACIIEATNKNEDWAKTIGNLYFDSRIISEDFFNFLNNSNIFLGKWICDKIEEHSQDIDPITFINTIKSPPSKIKNDLTWTNWIIHILTLVNNNLHDNTIDFNKININNEEFKNIPLPSYKLPSSTAWENWYLLAKFECDPTLINLITLLDKIEKSKTLEYWKEKKISFSWPFLVIISHVNNSKELKNIITKLKKQKLGNEEDWLKAQKYWNHDHDLHKFIDSTSISINEPWTLESIFKSAPLLTTDLSHLSYFIVTKSRMKDREDLLIKMNELMSKTKSFSLKNYLSVICLSLWKKLPLKDQKKYIDSYIDLWVTNASSYQTVIIPRSNSLSLSKWSDLLTKIPLKEQDLFIINIRESLFRSLIQLPSHPTLLYFTADIFSRFSFTHLDHSAQSNYLDQLREAITSLNIDNFIDPLTKANLVILKIFCGDLSDILINNLLSIIYKAYEFENKTIFNALAALKKNNTPQIYTEIFVSQLYNFTFDKNYAYSHNLMQEIHELLQKRTSELEVSSTWNNLALPFPLPEITTEKRISGGIPEKAVHINSIHLEEIGAISQLTLDFTPPKEDVGQWIVILGPNGSGKTTLLKSFVIALRNIKNPSIWPRGVFGNYWRRVKKDVNNNFTNSSIKVILHNSSEHTVQIRPNNSNGLDFSQYPEHDQPQLFPIFAYGCRRGSALGGISRQVNLDGNDGPEIATLFEEGADLIQAETWLVTLEGDITKNVISKIIFENTIDALKKLMDLHAIEVFDQKLWAIEADQTRVPFSCLSDGYLTNAGWFLDLIARWLKHAELYSFKIDKDFLNNMTGLVLIDEIDLHLHPQWQIEIISRTKKILPKMSFIVSTHNPLTLVGANRDEIWILNRNDELITASQGIETPLLLTSGQIYRQYFDIKDIYPAHLGRLLQRFSYLANFDLRNDEEESELLLIAEDLSKAGIETGWEITPRKID
ncbi:AAA family ATPase [Acinetobacter guillouiae]|uniref:AAA family ATPase n=1 Tax=Acinetobacter guillouiae TaxID=106649 RepID=UPI00300A5936